MLGANDNFIRTSFYKYLHIYTADIDCNQDYFLNKTLNSWNALIFSLFFHVSYYIIFQLINLKHGRFCIFSNSKFEFQLDIIFIKILITGF